MSEIIVWTMDDCPICEEVKEKMKSLEMNFEERSCGDLVNGNDSDLKAVRKFVQQKKTAPLIKLHGEFVKAKDFLDA